MEEMIDSAFLYLTWETGTLPVLKIIVTVALWGLIYTLSRQALSYQSTEYCCRIVTLLHGVTVASISGMIHFYYGPAPWNNFGSENTPLQNQVLLLSLGYFLFDFMWCCLIGSEAPAMLAHHIVSISGFSYAVYTQRFGSEVTAVCLGAEITNPLLQFRWFLREHGRYESLMGNITDYLLVFGFAFWRFVPGTYLLYRAMMSDKVDIPLKIGACALYCISAVFLYGVIKFFLRKYIWKMTKPSDKNN